MTLYLRSAVRITPLYGLLGQADLQGRLANELVSRTESQVGNRMTFGFLCTCLFVLNSSSVVFAFG
jgi:hypothetical protein